MYVRTCLFVTCFRFVCFSVVFFLHNTIGRLVLTNFRLNFSLLSCRVAYFSVFSSLLSCLDWDSLGVAILLHAKVHV